MPMRGQLNRGREPQDVCCESKGRLSTAEEEPPPAPASAAQGPLGGCPGATGTCRLAASSLSPGVAHTAAWPEAPTGREQERHKARARVQPAELPRGHGSDRLCLTHPNPSSGVHPRGAGGCAEESPARPAAAGSREVQAKAIHTSHLPASSTGQRPGAGCGRGADAGGCLRPTCRKRRLSARLDTANIGPGKASSGLPASAFLVT